MNKQNLSFRDKKHTLEFAKKVVDRLIAQYQEYLILLDQIKVKENQKLVVAANLSKENNKNVLEILRSVDEHPVLKSITGELELLKKDLQQVSDEMTFGNPLIWMMYKYKAYAKTPQEINTLYDFRKHCAPEGYICTKRYQFLKRYLQENYTIDVDDKEKFPDSLNLKNFYTSEIILRLLQDVSFLAKWKDKEYNISNNKINKWYMNNG